MPCSRNLAEIEGASINMKVSQHIALHRLVSLARQDFPRIRSLLDLSPPLEKLVFFNGARWVPSGLEEATREALAASAVISGPPKAPNVLMVMADKLPNSRAQIASLRLSPDDPPSLFFEGLRC